MARGVDANACAFRVVEAGGGGAGRRSRLAASTCLLVAVGQPRALTSRANRLIPIFGSLASIERTTSTKERGLSAGVSHLVC